MRSRVGGDALSRLPSSSPNVTTREGGGILIDLAKMPDRCQIDENSAIYDENLDQGCRFSSFLSHGTALTWSAAEILIELSPAFLTDLSFSSATECERHPDLAGSDHRLKPRLSPRVSGGGLPPYGVSAPNADSARGGLTVDWPWPTATSASSGRIGTRAAQAARACGA
jgi:hypothetical protein